jgi:hypothetical protein
MKKLFTIAGATLIGLQLNAQKLEPSAGIVNLTTNPTIIDYDGDGTVELNGLLGQDYIWKWSNTTKACGFIDAQVTHTDDGSFSYQMTGERYDTEGNERQIYEGSIIFGTGIKVQPGDEISFSFYAKTDQLPAPSIKITREFYKATWDSHWRLSPEQKALSPEFDGTFSEADVWQEFVVHYTIVDTVIKYFVPQVRFTFEDNINLDGDVDRKNYRPVWIDDMHCSVSRLFIKEKATANNTFDGADVKVDAAGNIIANKTVVFPFAMANGYDDEYTDYKDAGFNTVVVTDADEAQVAVNKGLNYIMDFTQYFSKVDDDDDTQSDNIQSIKDIITTLKTNSILSNCLFYRLNNEQVNRYQIAKDVCTAIKDQDKDRPVYFNAIIHPLEIRRFVDADTEDPFIDMAGASVGDGQDSRGTGAEMLAVGNYSDGIKVPFNIAELSTVEADIVGAADTSFFASVYAAIANGAKGIIFTSDDPDALTDYKWWNDLPTLKTELDKLMTDGIIAAPEADWKISLSDESKNLLDWGARTVGDKNYLIISNMATSVKVVDDAAIVGGGLPYHIPVTVTVNVDGLGYNIDDVTNLLSSSSVTITNVTATSFDIEVPALGYAVLELKGATTGINDIETGVSVYPNPTTGNITIDIDNKETQNVVISNITGSIVKQAQISGRGVINLADLANGVYFVRVGNSVTKVVLSK